MYRIEAIAPVHLPGFRLTLDQLAREARYFSIERAPSLARLSADVAQALAQGSVHLVALVQGRVVGWCDIVPSADNVRQGVLRMGVEAAQRGHGIGAALIGRAIEAAWTQGMQTIHTEIYNGSPDAARFCARAGFVQTQTASVAASQQDAGAMVINMALSRTVQ